MFDLVLLASLLDGPKHGYRLKRQAGRILGAGALHNNVVYPLLARFTAEGLVVKRTAEGERGQRRNVYELTGAGRRALSQRLAEFGDREAESAQAFAVRVGLFELLDPAARRAIVERRLAVIRRNIEHLEGVRSSTSLGGFGAEVVTHLERQAREEAEWLVRLLDMVDGGQPQVVAT